MTRRWAAVALTALAGLLLLVRHFPPSHTRWYPVCPIYFWTGLLCPGCGATRALAALSMGRFGEALHWNGLIVAMLAAALIYLVIVLARGAWPKIPAAALVGLLAVSAIFGLVRNFL